MVRLPSGALRRRVPPLGTVAWGGGAAWAGCNPECKVNTSLIDDEIRPTVDILSHSGMPRQHVDNLEEAYDIKGALGSGGFGIVRKASSRTGGPWCAVKTIAKKSEHAVELANREALILQDLSHGNICKLLDVCEDPSHLHLVLEYVDGHELFDEIVPQKPMKESRAACIMKQVFAALQHCHEPGRSVIHRDLKPENIMIAGGSADTDIPKVTVIDFGLAMVCEDIVETPIVGTACYMAPEALSMGIYSRASDMWSAGAILHMLVTGGELPQQFRPLCSSNGSTSLFHNLETSRLARSLLESLLMEEPHERLSASQAAKHSWATASNTSQELHDGSVSCALQTIATPQTEQLVGNAHSADAIKSMTSASNIGYQYEQQPSVQLSLMPAPDGDFIIFDDFVQTGESYCSKASKRSARGKGRCDASENKPRLLRQSALGTEDCKENVGPRSSRVRRHAPTLLPPLCAEGLSVHSSKKSTSSRPLPLRG